jgi:hypothetical protein
MARSSNGSGPWFFKPRNAGSNPVRAALIRPYLPMERIVVS